MPAFLKVACLQVNAGDDLEENLRRINRLLLQAVRRGAQWICLPENFCWRGSSRDLQKNAAQTPRVIRSFQEKAKTHGVTIFLGSLLEKNPPGHKFWNTSVLISEKGKVTARYRKIHLFGIALKKVKTDESRHIKAGAKIVTAKIRNLSVGLSICYDLRFPELFRELVRRGARILFVPANFTAPTGKAHWEILLRARAIENQCFVIAPAQSGISPSSGIESYGHSLMIDPWGKILAQGSSRGEEVVLAKLDLGKQERLRREFPVLKSAVLLKKRGSFF